MNTLKDYLRLVMIVAVIGSFLIPLFMKMSRKSQQLTKSA